MRQLKSSKQSPTPTKYYPMLISVGTMMLQVTRTAAVQALAVAVSVGSQISSKRSSVARSEEHTSELQSRFDLVCRLLLEKKNSKIKEFECRDEYMVVRVV